MQGRKETNKTSGQAAEEYRKILESLHEGYLLVDQDGDIKEANPAYCKMTGYGSNELSSMNLADLRSDISPQQVREVLTRLSEGESRNFESHHQTKDGTILTLMVSAAAIERDDDILIAGLMRDITEQRKAHQELENTKNRFQSLFDNNPNPVFRLNLEGGIERVNDAVLELSEYAQAELQQMHITDMVIPEERQAVQKNLETIIQGNAIENEVTGLTKDGNHLLLRVNSFPVTVEGKTVGIFRIVQDITEKRKAEKELAQTQQRFESLFKHNPHSVYYMDLGGNYQGANSQMESLTGYSRKELLELNFAPLIAERDLERTQDHFEKAAKGEIRKYEIVGITKQGDEKQIRVTNFPMIVDDKIVGVFGIAEDMTEQVDTYRKLKKAHKQFESLFKHNPHPVFYFDLDGHILDANEALQRLSDYSHEELVNLPFSALVSEEDRPKAKQNFEATLHGEPQTFEINGLTKQSQKIPVQVSAFPMIIDDEMTAIYAIAENISERKESEKKLKESEQRWYRLIENSPQSVVISVDKKIEYVNKAGVKLLGCDSHEEVVGQSLLEFAHPDDHEAIKKRISRMLADEPQSHNEQKIIDQNGEIKYIIAHSVHIKYKGQDAIQSLLYNVTDRKRKEQVIRDSLKEKEIMLQEIHHRVKNNMAVISGLLELQALNTTDQNLQALLKESQMRIHSMAMIHEKLYASQSLARIPFDEYAKELVQVIMNTLGNIDTELTVRYRMDSASLNINQAIPCGLILNELVTNCYKHAFNGREAGTVLVGFSKQDDHIKLSVEDNGTGLPENFDFGNEDGLGMTIVQTLVKQLEGELTTPNCSEVGTCFVISFDEEHTDDSQ